MTQKRNGLSPGVRLRLMALITACGCLLFSGSSRGNTWVWTGGGANDNWNNSANWGSVGFPANGDTVIFQGTVGLKTTNNIASLTLSQIRFINSGFTIYGNAFTITNSIVATNFTGTVAISNSITVATATVTLLVSNNITLTLGGNIAGSVGVTKTGLGTVTYNGPSDNTYSGTTLVAAGTLQLNVGGNEAFGGPLLIGDGTGNGSPVVRYLQYFQITGSQPVTVNLGGLYDLNGLADEVSGLIMQGGTVSTEAGALQDSGNLTVLASSATATINGNLEFPSGMPIISVANGTPPVYALDIEANIYDNNFGLFFTNSVPTNQPFIVLNGNNASSLTGPVILNNLILSPINSFALGATNSVSVGNDGILWLYSSSFTNKTMHLAGGANLTSQYNNTWAGPIVLGGNVSINGFGGGGTLTLAGQITGTGNINATADSGNWILLMSGFTINTFSGDFYMQLGTLELARETLSDGAIPNNLFLGDATHSATNRYFAANQIGNGSTVTLNGGSLMDLNGYADAIGSLEIYGGCNVTTGSGFLEMFSPGTIISPESGNGFSTISGQLSLGNSVTVMVTNDLFIPATITGGNSSFSKTGSGNLILQNANTYSATTYVQQGFVWAENPLALGLTNAGVVVSSGATLVLSGGISITNETLTLNGPGVNVAWGSLDVETGTNTWAGPIINNGSSTLDAYYPGSALHISGPISGPGSLELFGDPSGGGTHFFEGPQGNTYAGLTTIDAGSTLDLNKAAFSNAAIPATNVVVSGTLRLANYEQIATNADVLVNSGGLFDFQIYEQDLNTLRGTGSVTFGVDGYLNIGVANGISEFDGTMSGTGFIGGYTLGKYGSGTFIMTGTNTYLNQTKVFRGALVVEGSQPQSPVVINSGAELAGRGTVGSITAFGTVVPGFKSTGILSCSNVVFTNTATFFAELDGTVPGSGYSQLNPLTLIGSNLLNNATLEVFPNFASPVSIGQTFTILSNATPNHFNGIFNGLPEGTLFTAGGYTFRISYVGGTGNDLVLTLWGVPQNTVTVNATDKGWYDSTGGHTGGSENYFAGAETFDNSFYRNYFVFDVPVSTNSIVHAELLVNDYNDQSTNQQENYVVHKIATAIPTLEATQVGQIGIYNDLGTGVVYSVRSVATNESYQQSIIPLNARFMSDAMAASGSQIALGGFMPGVTVNNQNQFLFGASGFSSSDVQLVLVYGTNQLINAADLGWYQNNGQNDAPNGNYVAGAVVPGDLTHNYYVFNLPAISSQLVDAQLLVNSYSNDCPAGFENYQLYDVTNSITALTTPATTATNIYADLGSGLSYGGRDVYGFESYQIATIPLNQGFLNAAHTNSGSKIALGGAIPSLNASSTMQYLFGYSQGLSTDANLWLGYYTEPVSQPVFLSPSPTYLGNNQYQMTVSGTANTTIEIQGSFDFQHWDFITDVLMNNSSETFIYTNNAMVMPDRFFRAEALQ